MLSAFEDLFDFLHGNTLFGLASLGRHLLLDLMLLLGMSSTGEDRQLLVVRGS